MGPFTVLVKKELLVLSRDRLGLAVLFLMPALFILIMSLALQDRFQELNKVTLEVLWVDHDGGAFAKRLEERLAGTPEITLRRNTPAQGAESGEALIARIAREGPAIALVLPGGFEGKLRARLDAVQGVAGSGETGSEKTEDDLATLIYAPTLQASSRAFFLGHLRQAISRLLVRELFSGLAPGGGEGDETLERLLAPGSLRFSERFAFQGTRSGQAMTSVQQSVPAWLVFSMFFVVIPISTAFIVERQQGSLLRLRLMNIHTFQLVAAKVLPYYLVNITQMVLMLLVGVFAVPAIGGDQLVLGGSYGGLWLIGSGTSVAAIGFALLVSTLATTSVQATTAAGAFNLVFGALGGIMVPKVVMPAAMQAWTVVSPMAWAMEGFLDIILRQGAWHEALPEAGALFLFGLACIVLASAVFHRANA